MVIKSFKAVRYFSIWAIGQTLDKHTFDAFSYKV